MKKATRQSYGEALEIIGKDENVFVLDADLSSSTKTQMFASKYPDRFINLGISEADMVGTAAGIALMSKIVFASSFAIFLVGRAYDQIRQSIAYNNANVKLVSTHSGLSAGQDGATHQMLEDIAVIRSLPNMKIYVPSDDISTKKIIERVYKEKGPAYIRLSRLDTECIYKEDEDFSNSLSKTFGDGDFATIFAIGDVLERAIEAKKILQEKDDINIRVIDMFSIKPIDEENILKAAKETEHLFSLEDHNIIGGLRIWHCRSINK